MKKQTAIEYLGLELNMIFYNVTPEIWNEVEVKFKQALEMEKEQITDAYVECYMNHVGNGESILREANSYYRKTYEYNDEQ